METIGSIAWRIVENMTDNSVDNIHDALIKIATEQDRISRKEEREECAKKAEDWYCYKMCEYLKTHGGGCDWIQRSKCDIPEQIRKAIEEGGSNGN